MFRIVRPKTRDDPLKSAFIINPSPIAPSIVCHPPFPFDCVRAIQRRRAQVDATCQLGLLTGSHWKFKSFSRFRKMIAWLPHHIVFPSPVRQRTNKRGSPVSKRLFTQLVYLYTCVDFLGEIRKEWKAILGLFRQNESKRITGGISTRTSHYSCTRSPIKWPISLPLLLFIW